MQPLQASGCNARISGGKWVKPVSLHLVSGYEIVCVTQAHGYYPEVVHISK
ncbi:MAG: hypothetical protein RBR99_05490 [Dehalococcoidales bacterium]|nr:hypothetical protein [Dehalococcoidales bacterium]NLE90262.1 hypothetical protein [Dehalococcoidales bacterium]